MQWCPGKLSLNLTRKLFQNRRNGITSLPPQQVVFDRAVAQLRGGDAALASSICLEGLDLYPDDANILCLAGQSLIALKRFDEARGHIEKAKTLHPAFATSHETFADLLLLEGRFEDAITSYQQALHLDPGRSQINTKIHRATELKKSSTAADDSQPAMAFTDEMAKAAQFTRNDEPEKSESIYRDILRRDPNHVEAMRLLAQIAANQEYYEDSELLLRRAVKRAPHYARAWLDLSATQMKIEKNAEAVSSAEQLVKLTPHIVESHIALANAQAKINLTDLAIESYRSALKISPQHPGAFMGLAHQLKTIGRQQESIEVYRQNISVNPRNSEPYWSLANLKTFRFEDEEVKAMEDLLQDASLNDITSVQLCNSLGLEYEGRRDYDRAFEYFQRCNEKRRESESYDPIANEVTTEQLIEIFDEQFFEKNQGHGSTDPAPIFVIGLPRSGSTLIEQILASHSQVEGTHELSDLPRLVRASARKNRKGLRFPEIVKGFEPQAWSKLGDKYLASTQKYRSGLPRFIDKNPNNFTYVGLLHLILPNAKIINARRHPLDSCFGSYKQLFASGQPFSYDLTELGEYYLQYQTLMDHWHRVMPGGILDVNYEEVVADLDTQVRRILDYCELPFEEACLNFHETDRAVKTASSEQVRRPIYSSSVNLWQHYESHLAELIEILEPLLLARPPDEQPASLRVRA